MLLLMLLLEGEPLLALKVDLGWRDVAEARPVTLVPREQLAGRVPEVVRADIVGPADPVAEITWRAIEMGRLYRNTPLPHSFVHCHLNDIRFLPLKIV